MELPSYSKKKKTTTAKLYQFSSQKNIGNNMELGIVNNDSLEHKDGENIVLSSEPISKGSTQHLETM